MLYFLNLTSMDRISVVFGLNSFLPAKTLSTFDQYILLVWRFYYVTPITLTTFKARGVTLNQQFGFVEGKHNFYCIDV